MVSIGSSALQVRGRFSMPALAPVAFNASLLAGTAYCLSSDKPLQAGVSILATSFSVGVAAMVLIIVLSLLHLQHPKVRVANDRAIAASPQRLEEGKSFIKIFLPYLLVLTSTYGIQ
jgi:peptidoglycan biosynthesis protein MviN/MurJ (putative lipid II flippase)